MVPIWNISPPWWRVVLILTAGVVGLSSSGGLGVAQDRATVDFQARFAGKQVLPLFTQPQNRFNGALTEGSAWTTPEPQPSLLVPAPMRPLDPAASQAQPTSRETGATSSPEPAILSTDSDPDSRVDETASAAKRDDRTTARPPQRRERSLRRSAAERRARPVASAPAGDGDNPGGTPMQAANPRHSRSAGARIRDRDAVRRSAEAGQLPSVLRLEDQPGPHPRDSLGTQ